MDVFEAMFRGRKEIRDLKVQNNNLCFVLKWAQNHIDNESVLNIIANFLKSDKNVIPDLVRPGKEEIIKAGYPLPPTQETAPAVPNMPKEDIEKNIKKRIEEFRQSITNGGPIKSVTSIKSAEEIKKDIEKAKQSALNKIDKTSPT